MPASDTMEVASDEESMSSNGSWHQMPPVLQDAACQTDALPSLKPLAVIIEEYLSNRGQAQTAAVAAPAQAAAGSSAQPPALRPQAGNGKNYFTVLGNFCGRWGTVDGVWRRASKCGKRFMREIPRCYDCSDEHEETRLALLAHTEYWMGEFLGARNLSQKFILASKSEIDPRLSKHMPVRAMFYRMQHLKRPPPRRTAMTRFYFHGTFPHTVWPISDSEQFMDSINGSPEGHEASTPGVYASDRFEYGIGHYGWPANLFRDGMFYRFGFIIQAEHNTRGHEKNRGTL